MKGKIAFVLGLAAGYVLGSRAGRQRYEQIKTGANALWQTKAAVKCRTMVGGFARDKVSGATDYVVGKGKQLLHTATKPEPANEDRGN